MSATGTLLPRIIVMAAAAPLLYCAALVYGFEGILPWPGWWLLPVAFASALVGAVLHASRIQLGAAVFQTTELLLRYGLALLLVQFALNKLIPGQFLLYNRDFDLPLRELPARRLAWHFLGYSSLYNGFVAAIELSAGLLLCFGRTVVGGALLSAATLINIVVIDTAFGIRGALPIAAVMASAAGALSFVHLDRETLQSLIWRTPTAVSEERVSLPRGVLGLVVAVVLGYPLYVNLATRRGLDGQVPAAGRWEILDCTPNPGMAICQLQQNPVAPVLYLEVGQWGQLVLGEERRNLSFSYDRRNHLLAVRIAPSQSTTDPALLLEGSVARSDTTISLETRSADIAPFTVRLKRTHVAPWPPVRAF